MVGATDGAMQRLLAHPWPGNIRELENVIERCILFSEGDRIDVGDLPPEVRVDAPSSAASPPPPKAAEPASDQPTPGLKEAVREAASKVERELIVRALSQTGGNVTHTARLLKISRKSLQTKMKELGLREEG